MPDISVMSGTAWGLGSLAGALMATALYLRKYLSKEAVSRAANGAEKDIIEILRQQLKLERERSASLLAALDTATTQIGQLKMEILNLNIQVRTLQDTVNSMKAKT